MVVIVRKSVVHICYVQVVPIRNSLGVGTSLLHEGIHLANADAVSSDVGFTHEILGDSTALSFSHTHP